MRGDAAVATHGLTKRYGRETALEDASLRVPDGAVYAGRDQRRRQEHHDEAPHGSRAP